MGLLEKIFPRHGEAEKVEGYFKTLTAYTPVFTTFEGGVYEVMQTRAAIHAFANHISKLKPVYEYVTVSLSCGDDLRGNK